MYVCTSTTNHRSHYALHTYIPLDFIPGKFFPLITRKGRVSNQTQNNRYP